MNAKEFKEKYKEELKKVPIDLDNPKHGWAGWWLEEQVEYLMESYAKQSHASQQMPSEEEREKLIIFLEWYLDNGITVYDESDESKEAVDEYLKSLQPKQKEQLKNCIGTDYGGFKGEREVKEV